MKALCFQACPIPSSLFQSPISPPSIAEDKRQEFILFLLSFTPTPHPSISAISSEALSGICPLLSSHRPEYLKIIPFRRALLQPPNWLSAPSSSIPLAGVNHLLKMQSMSLCTLSSGSFNILWIATWQVTCCLSDILPKATFWVNLPFVVQSKGTRF